MLHVVLVLATRTLARFNTAAVHDTGHRSSEALQEIQAGGTSWTGCRRLRSHWVVLGMVGGMVLGALVLTEY